MVLPARQIDEVLAQFERDGVRFHALRSRGAGRRGFVSLHVLSPAPGRCSAGHDLVEKVEPALRERLPYATVFTHLEARRRPAVLRRHRSRPRCNSVTTARLKPAACVPRNPRRSGRRLVS